jgi:hypothetical protein
MSIKIIENSTFHNDKMIANFSVKKIRKTYYEISNGKSSLIRNSIYKNLEQFQREIVQNGCFIFYGSEKEFSLMLENAEKTA